MTKQTIEAAIRSAFAEVVVPPNAILQPTYTDSEDAYEFKQILSNRTWTEISRRDLFRHREMLIALAGEAYRAYVPAYLLAALADDDEYGADLRQYLVHSLASLSDDEVHVRTAAERLSRLDVAQRAAVVHTLRFVVETYRDKAAAALLSTMQG